jgi:predicted AlkP superfamily pyrophosphatase or phosphodiesterase
MLIGHNKTPESWSVLVAHFLGVDHCGHRYGPDHFETDAKLTQLNGFLDSLFSSVDNDTLVLVVGDHGKAIARFCLLTRLQAWTPRAIMAATVGLKSTQPFSHTPSVTLGIGMHYMSA